MNKQINNDEIFEHHLEETVALFMDRYARDLFQQIQETPEEIPYPDELDKRCLALIRKARKKEQLQVFHTGAWKALSRAAMVLVALLSLVSILFISVKAFRKPIIDFFFQEKDGYWDISGGPDATGTTDSWTNIEDPLVGLLPIDYELVKHEESEFGYLFVEYQNENRDVIWLSIYGGTGILSIDSENADKVQLCTIGDFDAIYVEKDGCCHLIWVNDLTYQKYSLYADNLDSSEFWALAEKIIKKTT